VILFVSLILTDAKITGTGGATFAMFQDFTSKPILEFGTMNLKSGKFNSITAVDTRFEMSSTASRTMTFTADGIFHIGVEEVATGIPWLMSVDPQTGTAKYIFIDETCFLWQLAYDTQRGILYGMNVQNQYNVTLFTIDETNGNTQYIGQFPLSISKEKIN